MKNEPITNLIGYYILAGGVLAVALGYFVIRPDLSHYQDTSQKLKVENAKIAELVQADKDTQALRQAYTTADPTTGLTIQQQRDRILSQLPPADQAERLMSLLSTLGAQNSVALNSFTPQGVSSNTSGGAYIAYPVNITITGTFSQIQGFLASIEKSARFIDLEGVGLSKSSNSSALSAAVVLQAYYQQNPPSGVVGTQ